MSYTANKLVAIAKGEVGYLEKETGSNLDSKTANAGDENYTKYARDLREAGYYNGNKQGQPWCDVFHDHCHYIAAGRNAQLAQEVTCQTGNLGAGCRYSADYYKKQGRFFKDPMVGDQIFFLNSKKTSVSHTGIVVDVDDIYVCTVEGNTSSAPGVVANGGCVAEKKYKKTYDRIYGYGRPKYDAEDKPAETTTTTKTGVCNVEIKVLKKGTKGAEVKAMQILLIGYGYSCGEKGADGSFGGATENALKAYQKSRGLDPDGSCGGKTWASLLGTG